MKKVTKMAMIAVLIGAMAVAGYFYWQYRKVTDVNNNTEVIALVKQVGKLMLLPTGETPTVATVTDKTKLNDQKFFKNSENGDKVLIYTLASKAILYRPKTNLIIEVASVTANDQNQLPLPTQTAQTQILKVVLSNGTQTGGLTTKWEKNIKSLMNNVDVISKISAKGNYQATIVVDLTGNLGSAAAELAGKLNATVATLPAGETKPEGDLLVILGSDKQ